MALYSARLIDFLIITVYVEAGTNPDPVRLEVVLFGTANGPIAARRWRLRVTHLTPRDAPLAAPSHCLQYYTARSGTVQSFNYKGTGGYTVSPTVVLYHVMRISQSCDFSNVYFQ